MAKKIIIAGGGTGGHLFPGIAIAQAFMKKDDKNSVLFIGTGKPFEKRVTAAYGFGYASVAAEGIKKRGLFNQIKALLKIPYGMYQSLKLFREFQPDLMIGVGGYSSGPVALAAKLKKIPVVLQEQNVLPGMTNRVLSKIAERVYVSFQHTFGSDPAKTLWTGNPVRNEFSELLSSAKAHGQNDPTGQSDDRRRFCLLILGGSQGAHAVNLAATDALPALCQKDRFHFIHQTGADDEHSVRDAYRKNGISHTAAPFFDDMPAQYQKADLLICRAGATTVAEAAVMGKPAVYIPFPFAADNHQELNARAAVEEQAADILLQSEISGNILAEKIMYYASRPDVLNHMASRARLMGKPDAAADIVDDCYKVIGLNKIK